MGGIMKAYALKSYSYNKFIFTLMLMSAFIFFAAQIAYGAGTSKGSSTAPQDTRKKAIEHFESGEGLQKAERYREASKEYEKAVRIDDTYAEAHSNLGYTYRKQGLVEKAVKSYKKAIELNPKLAEAHEYLGETYAEMGKFVEAENELKILKELGSDEAHELGQFILKMKTAKG